MTAANLHPPSAGIADGLVLAGAGRGSPCTQRGRSGRPLRPCLAAPFPGKCTAAARMPPRQTGRLASGRARPRPPARPPLGSPHRHQLCLRQTRRVRSHLLLSVLPPYFGFDTQLVLAIVRRAWFNLLTPVPIVPTN